MHCNGINDCGNQADEENCGEPPFQFKQILFSHVHACVVLKHRPAELHAALWKYTFPKGVTTTFSRSIVPAWLSLICFLYFVTLPLHDAFSAELDSPYLRPVCVIFLLLANLLAGTSETSSRGKKWKIHSPWWSHAKVPCGDCGEISVGSEGKASSKSDGLGDGQSQECCKHREWHVVAGWS